MTVPGDAPADFALPAGVAVAAPPVPPDGKYVTQVPFAGPGTYVWQCLAPDGGAMTTQNVTFVVNP